MIWDEDEDGDGGDGDAGEDGDSEQKRHLIQGPCSEDGMARDADVLGMS
jgi:hypothetical protein